MSEGISIPRGVADKAGVPEDLDANVVGPYRFPNTRRRRVAALVYLVVGGLSALVLPWGVRTGPVLLGFGLLAGWNLMAAWPMTGDQEEALRVAAVRVPFAVGHASAAVTFHGLFSRPHWQVILYGADDPPARRALVEIDAINGQPLGDTYEEEIPPPP
jgi:hypothetical protein